MTTTIEKKPLFHELAIQLLNDDAEVRNEFAAIIKGATGCESRDALAAVPLIVAAMLPKVHVPDKARQDVVNALTYELRFHEATSYLPGYDIVERTILELSGEAELRDTLEEMGWPEQDISEEVNRIKTRYVPVAL